MTPNAVRNLRKRLGLSQKDLAERIQVNQSTIHRLETGIIPIDGPIELLLEQLAKEAA